MKDFSAENAELRRQLEEEQAKRAAAERRAVRAEGLRVTYQRSPEQMERDAQERAALRRRERRAQRQSWIALAAILVGIALLFGWILPRLYKPHWIEFKGVNPGEAVYCKRQWFGPTKEIKLRLARHDDGSLRWVAFTEGGYMYDFLTGEWL